MRLSVLETVIMASLAFLSGCATTSSVSLPDRHVEIAVSPDLAADSNAFRESLEALRPTWSFEVSSAEHALFNTTHAMSGDYGVCLAPERLYDDDGEPTAYMPMTCGKLHAGSAAQDLVSLVDRQSASAKPVETFDADSVRQIVQTSSLDDPACFSYVPMWLADQQVFALETVLAESYLIACARHVLAEPVDDPLVSISQLETREADVVRQTLLPVQKLSQWLKMGAALLTSQSDFIRTAFHTATKMPDSETQVLGQALESHTEMYAEKWTQSQLTIISAFEHVYAPGMDWLSDILAMMMYRSITSAPTVETQVYEKLVPAILPRQASYKRLSFRYAMVMRTCRLAGLLADVTPELVEVCLPGIDLALIDPHEESHMDFIYLLERAVTDKRHPRLTEATQEWLMRRCSQGECPWIAELSRAAFITPGLDPATRDVFEALQNVTPVQADETQAE